MRIPINKIHSYDWEKAWNIQSKIGAQLVVYERISLSTQTERWTNRSPGPYILDELTFDPSFTFTKGIHRGKMRQRSKVNSCKFYGPGARHFHTVFPISLWQLLVFYALTSVSSLFCTSVLSGVRLISRLLDSARSDMDTRPCCLMNLATDSSSSTVM